MLEILSRIAELIFMIGLAFLYISEITAEKP